MNKFTDQEKDALQKFRNVLNDLSLPTEQQSDFYLIRWLRAREMNLKAAEEMLRASLKWRQEYDADNLLSWQAPAQFQSDFAYDMNGVDKDGAPVFIVPFGKWDIKAAVASGQKDVYLRYFIQLCERAYDVMRKISKDRPADDPVTQVTLVWDLDGFSLRQLTARGTVDAILECVKRLEANYPEMMKISFNVNAPRIFALLFALVKPLLTERTLAKIQLFGPTPTKWKSALLKIIPADQLLPAYGGTRSPSKEFMHVTGRSSGGDEGADGDMCVVTIDAGETLNIVLDVKHDNSTLNWSFRTDDFDVGFALYYKDGEQILNQERVDSHLKLQEGSYTCTKAGRYTLAFDNTYSVVRGKTLHYMLSVVSPEHDDDF
ncbi:unnamed protein product [Allacma fusca]|uniref:Uncharacterized protein n=1 Tax=Allacma fusca TaxID=39272 RepID=A0A8J2LCG3_9HEXA|nr:unnamed protein product [Allacma fusca]